MLANMIKLNITIKKCNLSYNQLGEHVGQEMYKAINHNDIIESLDISNNEIPTKYIDFIKKKCF